MQYQTLQINITRTIWQTVRRITNEILGVKVLLLAIVACTRSSFFFWLLNMFSLGFTHSWLVNTFSQKLLKKNAERD